MNEDQNFHYDEVISRDQFNFSMTLDAVKQRQTVLNALELRSNDHVLEIGSGNGFLVRDIADIVGPAGRVIGVDISDPMTHMAQELCRNLLNTEFETADVTKLPFRNDTFDVVTATQCLSYVKEIEVALSEIHRVVKPGGRVVLVDTDWDTMVWNCTNKAVMNKMLCSFTRIYADAHLPRTLTGKLVDTGFQILERSSYPIVNWTHDPDRYAGLQIDFVKAIAKNDPTISDADLSEWLSDLHEIEKAGECFFTFNRYIFCAQKPRD